MANKDFSDIPYLAVGSVVAVQEELLQLAQQLVDKGKSLTPEGRKKVAGDKKGLVAKGDEFSIVVARTVQRVLENAGLVTRADLEDIDRRVSDIEKKVLTPKKTVVIKPAAKPAPKKPAKKASGKSPAGKAAAKKPSAPGQQDGRPQ